MTYLTFKKVLIFLDHVVYLWVFQIVANLQNIFQCAYWKKWDYKWTCAVQAHVVQGPTVLHFISSGFNNTCRELDTITLVEGEHHSCIKKKKKVFLSPVIFRYTCQFEWNNIFPHIMWTLINLWVNITLLVG